MTLRFLFAIHGPPDPATAVFQNVSLRAAYLRAAGHAVDIVTPADFSWFKLRRLDPLILPVAVAPLVPRYDAVVFHSYLGWAFHLARGLFEPRRHVTTITAFHGLEPLYHAALAAEMARNGRGVTPRFRLLHHILLPRLLKASCRASDAVLCLNTAERDYLTRMGWAEAPRVHIVANGVGADLFQPRVHRPIARRLLFVGQWLPAKGVRYLVDAFARVAARHDVELACIGTGASADHVLQTVAPSLRSRVSVRPRVDREQLAEELRRADVFVFPSLSEGASTALLEAMASGLPICATPAGAARDVLEDGRSARVVPCGDAESLVTAIASLLPDAHERRRLGEAAQRRAKDFEWDCVNKRYAELLLQTVRDRAGWRRSGAAEHAGQ